VIGRFTLHSIHVNSAWHSGVNESQYTVMFYADPRVGVNVFSQSEMCAVPRSMSRISETGKHNYKKTASPKRTGRKR